MITNRFRIAAPFAAVVLLSGCATIFTGTRDTIAFNSTPEGATVLIDGIERGRTPTTLRVKRTVGDRIVTLRLEGYVDRTFVLGKEFNVVSVLNLKNVLGWGVDAATGALFRYSDRTYHLELDRRQQLAGSLEVDEVFLLTELERNAAGDFVLSSAATQMRVAAIDPITGDVLMVR
jgi:hypothetical protein